MEGSPTRAEQGEFLKHKEEVEDENRLMEARIEELEAEKLEGDVAREAQEAAQGDAELKVDEMAALEDELRRELDQVLDDDDRCVESKPRAPDAFTDTWGVRPSRTGADGTRGDEARAECGGGQGEALVGEAGQSARKTGRHQRQG